MGGSYVVAAPPPMVEGPYGIMSGGKGGTLSGPHIPAGRFSRVKPKKDPLTGVDGKDDQVKVIEEITREDV